MPILSRHDTILAIDPTSRGFAFAVLEAPAFLVDWGERIIPAKTGGLFRKVEELLSRYDPSLLAIEDVAVPHTRRRKRASKDIRSIELLALKRGLAAERISRLAVRDAFAPAKSKFEVALRLAETFPALAERLPRKRKAWTTEDARMNIFDAVGFASAAMKKSGIAGRPKQAPFPCRHRASRLHCPSKAVLCGAFSRLATAPTLNPVSSKPFQRKEAGRCTRIDLSHQALEPRSSTP